MAEDLTEMHTLSKALKDFFLNWRAVILKLKSVLLWEQYWHPIAIISFIGLILLLVNQTATNNLTMITIMGMILNVANFLMPFLHQHIEPTWSLDQDKIYEGICFDIAAIWCNARSLIKYLYTLKMEKPLFFFPIIIGVQLIALWITLNVNNNFIVCLIVTTLLLWPVVKRQYNHMMAYYN